MCAIRTPAILIAFALCSIAAEAVGAEPRRFSLEYRADASCPAENELVRQVEARVAGASRVTSAPLDVGAKVDIARRADGFHGSIELSGPDGPVRREVDGVDCSEVVRAVALMIALALDPDAHAASAPEPQPASAPIAPPPPAPPPSPRDASTLWLGAGALAGVMGGVAPTLAFYEGGYFELGVSTASALSPSFRLAAFRAQRSTDTRLGGVELSLLALRLSACPLRLGERWFATACATFDVGRLQGEGYATTEARTQHSFWYGPGAAIALGGLVTEALSVGLEFGIVAPLARDRFFFAPDLTAHRIPGAAGYAGLGFGFRS